MLQKKFNKKNIILASASPRRHELFKELGVNFSIKVKEVEETYNVELKEDEITNYLCKLKADAFTNEILENDIIITADTIVWHNNKALEKPKNAEDAIIMLKELSGKKHKVFSSFCVKTYKSEHIISDVTIVSFKELSQKEIEYYVENYQPFDKAGAYGIQEWIGLIGVTLIEGSYFNVMGLPVHKLYEELLKL
ncbi:MULTISPECIES: Maf family nucleotide pyrophosphatase [Flavobacteriaceae]|uniref:dTTP/UTP pyrophosphatase n=2 Tax=Flavobacteriaceae TaxID=49546 RepID=A0A4Y8AVJ3_9FLAO|nr:MULTISPECIES: Maf family nucleotide pyrophosphatase [Flavobacteriaceae]TEW75503.1 septum formation protein Maf [Gramella jeungdoensis]GGK45764.1 Maf-like protein [Lutibacter litoralis]